MEYADHGNLQQYLRTNRSPQQNNQYGSPESATLTSRDLTVFALHVACGMEYIADKEVMIYSLSGHCIPRYPCLLNSEVDCFKRLVYKVGRHVKHP